VMTEVPLGELIEDALKINQAGLTRHQVTLMRDYDPSIVFTTDRHRVLQILINLISNAKYAVDGNVGKKDIVIRAKTQGSDVQISVVDTGIGIEPENLTRIFSYGFTTKKNGHGFGLHSAALAAKELGGSIEVNSEGKGKGATFTLTLPIRKEALSHAG
jgi:two-component system NtrC family sensor kinase